MKKAGLIAFLMVMAFSFTQTELFAQDEMEFPKLDASPLDAAYYPARAAFRAFAKTDEERMANEPVIRVLYSRPQMKGREIYGNLVKYGEPWRVGANESAEILFLKDVTIGSQRVKAGRYTFYVLPSEDKWEVVFSTDLDGWGAYAYNADHNVASVSVSPQSTPSTVEAFTIMFAKADDGAHMIMAWGDKMCKVPVKF